MSQSRILPWHPLELASRKKPLRDLPMGNGHKGPVFIATFEGIVCPVRSDMAYYPFWTSEFDAQITSPSVVNVHCDGYMLKALQIRFLQHVACDIEGACQALIALGNIVLYRQPRRMIPCLWFDRFKSLCCFDKPPSVHLPVTE